MQIWIVRNREFGYGFQVQVIDGITCVVCYDEPLTLLEAIIYVLKFVRGLKREAGLVRKIRNIKVNKTMGFSFLFLLD